VHLRRSLTGPRGILTLTAGPHRPTRRRGAVRTRGGPPLARPVGQPVSLAWLFDTLRGVADFLHWRQRLAGVEGLLADVEGYALLRLAAHGGGGGAVSRSAATWAAPRPSWPPAPRPPGGRRWWPWTTSRARRSTSPAASSPAPPWPAAADGLKRAQEHESCIDSIAANARARHSF